MQLDELRVGLGSHLKHHLITKSKSQIKSDVLFKAGQKVDVELRGLWLPLKAGAWGDWKRKAWIEKRHGS